MTDKDFKDLTTEECKELKVEFAPGCFDGFEGTQEELDELIAQIQQMFASGEAVELAQPIGVDDLDDKDWEVLEQLSQGRTLQ